MPSKIDTYKLPRKHDRRCKTSDEDVLMMRQLYTAGLTQKTIADAFGVSQSAVSYAVSDVARENLARYRRRNPSKPRTKEEARDYARSLRAYKKELIEKEKNDG